MGTAAHVERLEDICLAYSDRHRVKNHNRCEHNSIIVPVRTANVIIIR